MSDQILVSDDDPEVEELEELEELEGEDETEDLEEEESPEEPEDNNAWLRKEIQDLNQELKNLQREVGKSNQRRKKPKPSLPTQQLPPDLPPPQKSRRELLREGRRRVFGKRPVQ
jgi:hypothetical protein